MSANVPASNDEKNRHRAARTPWPRRRKIVAAIVGASLAGAAAFAATNWVVGLQTGSSSEAQSGTVTNITIVAIATPPATNLLFPGGTGDVVAKITNPNNFPVTITAVNLPANNVYAAGFVDAALTATPQPGCDGTTSLVSFTFATATTNSSHTLTNPITIAANSNVTSTFVNDASMGNNSPSACQNTYFKMPSFTGVTATAGAAAPSNIAPNGWTA